MLCLGEVTVGDSGLGCVRVVIGDVSCTWFVERGGKTMDKGRWGEGGGGKKEERVRQACKR